MSNTSSRRTSLSIPQTAKTADTAFVWLFASSFAFTSLLMLTGLMLTGLMLTGCSSVSTPQAVEITLALNPALDEYLVGQEVRLVATVTDKDGKTIPDPNVVYSASPAPWANFLNEQGLVKFTINGNGKLSACVNNGDLCAEVSAKVSGKPVITILSPQPGTMIQGSASAGDMIEVRGSVSDETLPADQIFVTINNQVVTVDSTGAFTGQVPHAFGPVHISATASDSIEESTFEFDVFSAPAYAEPTVQDNASDGTSSITSAIENALTVQLTQTLLDSGLPLDLATPPDPVVLQDLEQALEYALVSIDFTQFLPKDENDDLVPLISVYQSTPSFFMLVSLTASDISFADEDIPQVDIEWQPGGLTIGLDLINTPIRIETTGAVVFDPDGPNGNPPLVGNSNNNNDTIDGTLVGSMDIGLRVIASYCIDTPCGDQTAPLDIRIGTDNNNNKLFSIETNYNADLDNFIADLTSSGFDSLISALLDPFEEIIIELLTPLIVPAIDGVFGTLDAGFNVNLVLPELLGGLLLDMQINPTVSIPGNYAQASADGGITVSGVRTEDLVTGLGVPLSVLPGTTADLPSGNAINMQLAQELLNTAFYDLWAAGALNLDLGPLLAAPEEPPMDDGGITDDGGMPPASSGDDEPGVGESLCPPGGGNAIDVSSFIGDEASLLVKLPPVIRKADATKPYKLEIVLSQVELYAHVILTRGYSTYGLNLTIGADLEIRGNSIYLKLSDAPPEMLAWIVDNGEQINPSTALINAAVGIAWGPLKPILCRISTIPLPIPSIPLDGLLGADAGTLSFELDALGVGGGGFQIEDGVFNISSDVRATISP